MVDVEHAFEVVAFVLNDSSEEAGYFFVMLLKVLVEPAQADVLNAGYVFTQAGEAEASFGASDGFAFEDFEFGVDECEFAAFAFGEGVGHGVCVDNDKADVTANLRSGQTNAFAFVHSGIHILNQRFEAFVFGGDWLGNIPEHGMAVEIYGKFHLIYN